VTRFRRHYVVDEIDGVGEVVEADGVDGINLRVECHKIGNENKSEKNDTKGN